MSRSRLRKKVDRWTLKGTAGERSVNALVHGLATAATVRIRGTPSLRRWSWARFVAINKLTMDRISPKLINFAAPIVCTLVFAPSEGFAATGIVFDDEQQRHA